MPVIDRGVARGDFIAYAGADNTFGVRWEESNGTEWVGKDVHDWVGRFEIWSLDKSTLYYRQEGETGYNGFQLDSDGNIRVTVPAEVFTDEVWLTRETVMYRLYAIPPSYDSDFNLITRDEVYQNFCTLEECLDNMKRIKGWINDLVKKVYGGGTVNDDGTITWPNDSKIAIGKLNIYSAGAEGDVFDNALRTRAANTNGDTKAV